MLILDDALCPTRQTVIITTNNKVHPDLGKSLEFIFYCKKFIFGQKKTSEISNMLHGEPSSLLIILGP